MTPDRLLFIETRLLKHQSAPDAAELGLELLAEVRRLSTPSTVLVGHAHATPPEVAFGNLADAAEQAAEHVAEHVEERGKKGKAK